MKKFFFPALVVLFVSMSALATQAASREYLCHGDSITEGYGVSVSYPTRLSLLTGVPCPNEGVGGELSSRGLSRIRHEIEKHLPTHILIMFGTNDVNGPHNLNGTFSNLAQMAAIARSMNVVPILGTIPPQIGNRSYLNSDVQYLNSLILNGASGNEYFVADCYSAIVNKGASSQMQSDNFHPNSAGAQTVAETFQSVVTPLPALAEPPTLYAPKGSLEDMPRPTFSWSAVPGASKYRLTVYRDGQQLLATWVHGTSWVATADLACANYSWWVRAYNSVSLTGGWSDQADFAYQDFSCCIPEEVDDLDWASEGPGRIAFSFDTDECASWYQLKIEHNGSAYFSQWYETGQIQGRHSIVVPDLPYGELTWWVRGWSPDGTGNWSDSNSFTYGKPAPITPFGRLLSPPATLTWDDSTVPDGEEEYELFLARDNAKLWSARVDRADTVVPAAGHRAYNLPGNLGFTFGTFEWWVRTVRSGANGPWSSGQTFTLGQAVPQTPAGRVPVDPGPLVWDDQATTSAEWYQFDVQRNGQPHWKQWIERIDTAPAGPGKRRFTLPGDLALPYGSYTWQLRSWQDGDTGPWSMTKSFALGQALPQDPSGSVGAGANITEFRWEDSSTSDATWYQFWIALGSGTLWNDWIRVEDTTPDGNERFFPVPAELLFPAGSYQWWIRPWNGEAGPWSDAEPFTVTH